MTTIITAAELIAARRAFLRADNERMSRRPAGATRSAWREANPVEAPVIRARDLRFKTKPERVLTFDTNGSLTDLWIWSVGLKINKCWRIDLGAPDADAQLAQFERI